MKLTEKQKAEEAEFLLCHKHIRKMLLGMYENRVNISVLVFCLELEVHRLKDVILEHTYAHPAAKDVGGMYR